MSIGIFRGTETFIGVLFLDLIFGHLVAYSWIPLSEDSSLSYDDLFVVQEVGCGLKASLS